MVDNNSCYHHDQVNMQKKTLQRINICLQSSHMFFRPALSFFSRLFVLKSWPNFCKNGNKLHGPLWPTVFKVIRNIITPPPPTLSSKDVQHTGQQGQQLKCSKRSTQQLHVKRAARLEALVPKTTRSTAVTNV